MPGDGHRLDYAGQRRRLLGLLSNFAEQVVFVASLIIEDRVHHQVNGRLMKFISICDPTGVAEVDIFAEVYDRFGIFTIRHPIVEVEACVRPLESGIGCTLEAQAIRAPRTKVAVP